MAERSRAQQEAFREISEETARAYREFLGTVLAYYRTNAGRTREAAREGAGAVVQTPGRLAAATTGALPISGYEEMNVSEITSHLEGLTEQELRRLRDYEVEHKNRRTVVGRIDRKLVAAR